MNETPMQPIPTWPWGRPPRHDYFALKPQLQALIEQGYGAPRIARHLGLSVAGARLVLRRIGLRTLYQTQREVA